MAVLSSRSGSRGTVELCAVEGPTMKKLIVALTMAVTAAAGAYVRAQNNWLSWGQDPGGTRFSTLNQINTSNVGNLKRAWTFHTGDSSGFFESTPIAVDGILYFSAPNGVYSVDGVTGQQIWKYETTGTARRGPTYWPGTTGVSPRIFSSTEKGMVALDAKTGAVVMNFGVKGFVEGLRLSSPAAIYKNVLITQGGASQVKAWDIVTGEPRWTLELKAQPGDPNIATWLNDSWKTSAGPGLWGIFTVDVERGLLFVPVEKVGSDYWGGPTPGSNLYSDSVLAVDANTGKIKWHQQIVHHDMWDRDLPAPPNLLTVTRDGKKIDAVAQVTKSGHVFTFNLSLIHI